MAICPNTRNVVFQSDCSILVADNRRGVSENVRRQRNRVAEYHRAERRLEQKKIAASEEATCSLKNLRQCSKFTVLILHDQTDWTFAVHAIHVNPFESAIAVRADYVIN